MKLLIAYDGSPGANDAVDDLSRAGLPKEVECKVVSVATVNPLTIKRAEHFLSPSAITHAHAVRAEHNARAANHAAAGLALIRERFPTWKVDSILKEGSPAEEILSVARDFDPDLIVVGARSHSPLQRFFLGSTSTRLAREAECSVRIARHRENDLELRILVAVDGSDDASATIDAVSRRSWPSQSRFHVATVVDPKVATVRSSSAVYAETWSHQQEASEEWTMPMLQHLTNKVRAANLDAECHVFDGEPHECLLAHAEIWRADAIFVGAHGLQHSETRALGTIASVLAARSPCTVEITRAPAK